MRAETPTVYRATFIERIGLPRWFAAPSRMILRHVERRPIKSMLPVLGITSPALMMVGNYQKGAIDFMVDVQFRQAAREDLAVTYIEPTLRKALHNSPPCRACDTSKASATCRRSCASKITAIVLLSTEYNPTAGCTARSTAACDRFTCRPEACVQTDHLADNILHVDLGDMLSVELLEGERRTSKCRCWASPGNSSACRRTCSRSR